MKKILITGSGGYLGEALMRRLGTSYDENDETTVIGVDIVPSPYTTYVGSIVNRTFLHDIFEKERNETSLPIDAIIHTATLHKPHIATHSHQDFLDTNLTGTNHLLQEAVLNNVQAFVFTSTTSLYGKAMKPTHTTNGGVPAATWITEDVLPQPQNIYGITKWTAEQLCRLTHEVHQLPILILRTSRFFPEEDDSRSNRDIYPSELNLKCNEMLYRRVDMEDIISAHQLALQQASRIGYDVFLISATTPFQKSDLQDLGSNDPNIVHHVVQKYHPEYVDIYSNQKDHKWCMMQRFDRVYVNTKARTVLGWKPKYDFQYWLQCLQQGIEPRSPITIQIMNDRRNRNENKKDSTTT